MIKGIKNGKTNDLHQILLGMKELSIDTNKQRKQTNFFNNSLNTEQKDAVIFCLDQRHLAIIHGPPGTGKTTTLIEVIRQFILVGKKILICAPSNVAIDNLLTKLVEKEEHIIRIGEPIRVQENMRKYTLEVASADKDINQRRARHRTLEATQKKEGIATEELKIEKMSLNRQIKTWEIKTYTDKIRNAKAVLSTIMSASCAKGPLKYIPRDHFDIIMIDESSQSKEIEAWLIMQNINKLILAGDYKQLPPMIASRKAAKQGLEYTMMERLIDTHGNKAVKTLTTQYRMNTVIMEWVSGKTYENQLIAHSSIATQTLADMGHVSKNETTKIPLLLIDTAKSDMLEHQTNASTGNHGEVGIVKIHVTKLINAGVKQEEVAIITPYREQEKLIRQSLEARYPKIEVTTIDNFQGREKESVLISMVRSNYNNKIGFMNDIRRLTVALTRAKRQLVIIGNSKMNSKDNYLKELMEYVQEKGTVRTAEEFKEELHTIVEHYKHIRGKIRYVNHHYNM